VHVSGKTAYFTEALTEKDLERGWCTKGRTRACISQGFTAFCSDAKSRTIFNCRLPIADLKSQIGTRKLKIGNSAVPAALVIPAGFIAITAGFHVAAAVILASVNFRICESGSCGADWMGRRVRGDRNENGSGDRDHPAQCGCGENATKGSIRRRFRFE
jgi:hypothetical protein